MNKVVVSLSAAALLGLSGLTIASTYSAGSQTADIQTATSQGSASVDQKTKAQNSASAKGQASSNAQASSDQSNPTIGNGAVDSSDND